MSGIECPVCPNHPPLDEYSYCWDCGYEEDES